ncbi:hypothetical protein AXF42_Ash004397 [Apostasia shenzhenica]|uniref:Uncharacterized protein n=1 Tax=Apostasia shenzhenica TaxID=1088818 RepID=A0A2I0A2S9_9ASPA|nr:hypothetical protein AXF42_Ash004397 [Apostasia shenzhenica]
MTVLSRLERLELMLEHLEEKRASGAAGRRYASKASSSAGVGTPAIEGGRSPTRSSPGSSFRSMEELAVETQLKGSLIDRVLLLESRLLKLEEAIENERRREKEIFPMSSDKRSPKSLKSMLKCCINEKSSKSRPDS